MAFMGLKAQDPNTIILPFLPLISSQLIRDCNSNVQRMRRTEELIYLSQKIEFECKVSCPWHTSLPMSLSSLSSTPSPNSLVVSIISSLQLPFSSFLEYANDHFSLQALLIGGGIELCVDLLPLEDVNQ